MENPNANAELSGETSASLDKDLVWEAMEYLVENNLVTLEAAEIQMWLWFGDIL